MGNYCMKLVMSDNPKYLMENLLKLSVEKLRDLNHFRISSFLLTKE